MSSVTRHFIIWIFFWPVLQTQAFTRLPQASQPVLPIRGGATSATELSSTLGAAIDTFWQAHPLVAAAVVCATKATLADLVAQRRQQRLWVASSNGVTSSVRAPLDLRRMLSFATYGAAYQGMPNPASVDNRNFPFVSFFYTFRLSPNSQEPCKSSSTTTCTHICLEVPQRRWWSPKRFSLMQCFTMH